MTLAAILWMVAASQCQASGWSADSIALEERLNRLAADCHRTGNTVSAHDGEALAESVCALTDPDAILRLGQKLAVVMSFRGKGELLDDTWIFEGHGNQFMRAAVACALATRSSKRRVQALEVVLSALRAGYRGFHDCERDNYFLQAFPSLLKTRLAVGESVALAEISRRWQLDQSNSRRHQPVPIDLDGDGQDELLFFGQTTGAIQECVCRAMAFAVKDGKLIEYTLHETMGNYLKTVYARTGSRQHAALIGFEVGGGKARHVGTNWLTYHDGVFSEKTLSLWQFVDHVWTTPVPEPIPEGFEEATTSYASP